MSTPDMSVTQMHWKPKLIRLTSIYPQFTDPVFIDPSHVHMITPIKPKNADDPEPLPACTLIYYCGNQYIHVKESTEEVARLCDEAFGHKHENTVRYMPV